MNDLEKQIEEAFENAIRQGRLSLDEASSNYVGDFMWMGKNSEGLDAFKNSTTRQYIK